MRAGLQTLLFVALLSTRVEGADEPTEVLRNGALAEWTDGTPVGWKAELGGRQGNGPTSTLSKLVEGGARLAGDASTREWLLLAQHVAVPERACCRLSFEARVLELKRDPGQFENCYVGVRLDDPEGKIPRRFVVDRPLRDLWTPGEVVFRAGRDAVTVSAFLSQSGVLEVRRLTLEVLRPRQSFDVLVHNMERYYSFLDPEVHGKGWGERVAALRLRGAGVETETEFVSLAKALLAPLDDVHVTIRGRDGKLVPIALSLPALNVNVKELLAALTGLKRVGGVGAVAEAGPGIGYLAVQSLVGEPATFAALDAAFIALFDRKGLVLDLRGNSGGDERYASLLVRHLTDESRVYAKRRYRSGPLPTDFGADRSVRIEPFDGPRFLGPVVVLIGPGCVSSGEGMAQMLDALPNVRLVGLPTRGASGNPSPVPLPNGLEVSFPRWQDFDPSGRPLETRGVQPDVLVKNEGPGDPTLAAGLVELERLLAK